MPDLDSRIALEGSYIRSRGTYACESLFLSSFSIHLSIRSLAFSRNTISTTRKPRAHT